MKPFHVSIPLCRQYNDVTHPRYPKNPLFYKKPWGFLSYCNNFGKYHTHTIHKLNIKQVKKEYKVVKISHNWSLEKLRSKVENTLNEYYGKGWEIISIDYLANTYTAMITFSR